jgi:hypothetical protein
VIAAVEDHRKVWLGFNRNTRSCALLIFLGEKENKQYIADEVGERSKAKNHGHIGFSGQN